MSQNKKRTERAEHHTIKTKKGKSIRFNPLGCLGRILVLAIIIIIIVFFARGSFFKVDSIKVEGNQSLTPEQIVNLSRLKTGENIFKAPCKIAEKEIAYCAVIDSVSVKRNFFTGVIIISVTERQGVAAILEEDRYYILDNKGVIINCTEDYNSIFPLITGYEQIDAISVGLNMGSNQIDPALQYAEFIKENGTDSPTEVLIKSDYTVNLYIDQYDNLEIRCGKAEDIKKKWEAFTTVYDGLTKKDRKKLAYIDISDYKNPVVSYQKVKTEKKSSFDKTDNDKKSEN